MMYEVWAAVEAGERCEGRRTGLRAAFSFARQLHREYHGAAKISVRLDGAEIESEISDMHLSRRNRRGLLQ